MSEDTKEPTPLPCPFCGAEGVTVSEGSTYRWVYAECNNCGARSSEARRGATSEGDRPAAIYEWNYRMRK